MRPLTPTPTSTPMSRSPIQVAESRLSTPTRALATTLRSQRRLPDHITPAFTSWTRRRAFTTCAPTRISRLQMMGIPALRALLIKQCPMPSKTQMALNTKWPYILMTGFSIGLSTTTRSSGHLPRVPSRADWAPVRRMKAPIPSCSPLPASLIRRPAISMTATPGCRQARRKMVPGRLHLGRHIRQLLLRP